jgi:ACS family tartrate transporter-like MFS transporter
MTATTRDAHDELGARVVSKVARRLIPFMCLAYLINYLDRTNIGFAKLTMSEDLGLTATMFGLASGLFFVGYLLFEVPSNLALHKFGARRWIARIMVSWGVVAAAMAFVQSPGQLYALRVLLGIAEAGFFPGMILYLTFWFPRRERVKYTSWFLLAIPLSAAVGSPLSGALLQFADGWFGLEGWRVMFLVEGLPAVLLGVVTWFYLTDRPADATWLDEEERNWLESELASEAAEVSTTHGWSLKRALTSARVLALAFVYFGVVYGLYALSFFLPSIVAGFSETFGTDFSFFQTGLIVSVPFVVGGIAMVVWGRHSDRTNERVWHTAAPTMVGALSIPIALYLDSPFLVMLAITITAVGIFATLPVFWSLPSMFLTGAAAAAGIALINSLGNLAGFAAPYVTGAVTDATGSAQLGMWFVGGLMFLAGVVVVVLGAAPRSETASPGSGEAMSESAKSIRGRPRPEATADGVIDESRGPAAGGR